MQLAAWLIPLLELLLALSFKTFRGDPSTGFCFVGGFGSGDLSTLIGYFVVPAGVKIFAGTVFLILGAAGAIEVILL